VFGYHRHDWKRTGTAYAPPVSIKTAGEFECSEHLVERMTWGVTTLLYECQYRGCGQSKTIEILGKLVDD